MVFNKGNPLTSEAALRRKVKEIRSDETDDDAEPMGVAVAFFDHELNPFVLRAEVEEPVQEGFACLAINVICIPTGMHLVDGDHWHSTGEVIDGIPIGRPVPNLLTTEEANASIEPLPSKIDERGPTFAKPRDELELEMPGPGNVTAEELTAAKAEAKAMREEREEPKVVDQTTDAERRIWNGIATRKPGSRYDFSALYPRWPGGNPPR